MTTAAHDDHTLGFQQRWARVQQAAMLAVLALLAAAVAAQEPLWVDEKITVNRVTARSYWELLTVLPQRQPHLPTYYLLIKALGFQAAQILSVLAFPLTALATVELAGEAGLDRTRAWGAGYLVAVSPFLATQASWLRMYSLLTLVLTIGLWQTLAGNHRRAAVAFAAGLLLHPFAVLPATWYACHVYRTRPTMVRPRYLAAAGTPFAGLVTVKYLKGRPGFDAFSTGVTHGIQPGIREIVALPASSLAGSTHTTGMLILAVATLFLAVARPVRRHWGLYLWILLPIAGVTAASYLLHPLFQPKYYGYIAPAVAVLVVTPKRRLADRYALWLSIAGLYAAGWVFRALGVVVTRYYRFLF